MPDYEYIEYEERGRVALITLNRPEKLNAWLKPMEDEFIDALDRLAKDDDLAVGIVTGKGRGFCAGADISAWDANMREQPEKPPLPLQHAGSPEVPIALMMTKPVIAAVNGASIGVGFTLTMACDIRIASTNARFSARFVRVGLSPECGSTRYLPLVAGFPNAMLLALTGRIIDAEEGLRRGLVDRLVDPEKLLDEAFALAEEIASAPVDATWSAKRLLHLNALEQDLRRVVTIENATIRELEATPGHAEAVQAFMERREPQFGRRPAD